MHRHLEEKCKTWELIKLEIRNCCIQYGARKKLSKARPNSIIFHFIATKNQVL